MNRPVIACVFLWLGCGTTSRADDDSSDTTALTSVGTDDAAGATEAGDTTDDPTEDSAGGETTSDGAEDESTTSTTTDESDTGDLDTTETDTGVPECTPSSGTTILSDDVVRDESTCLWWTRSSQAQGSNWPLIHQHCEDLVLEGRDDWRMPTRAEVLTWPIADAPAPFYDAALTAPRYVPPGTAEADIDGSFHVCAIAWWNGTDPSCQWWGPANVNGTFCVRGDGVLPDLPDPCAEVCAMAENWEIVPD